MYAKNLTGAEALQNDKRAGTVGFALTTLQRRLASSPEAIYQSLCRRRERLEKRLRELKLLQRGAYIQAMAADIPYLDEEDFDDLEDAPDLEVEEFAERVLDRATAARTIDELKAEIETLRRLESLAFTVRRSGEDRKWRGAGQPTQRDIYSDCHRPITWPRPPPPMKWITRSSRGRHPGKKLLYLQNTGIRLITWKSVSPRSSVAVRP